MRLTTPRIPSHMIRHRLVQPETHWQKEAEGPEQEMRLPIAGEELLLERQASLPPPAAQSIG